MSVDQTYESIIKLVSLSKLDYHMNQTPYSMHFSIKKMFLKGHNPNLHSSSEVPRDVEIYQIKQDAKSSGIATKMFLQKIISGQR